jgi:hypothetical protein
MAHFGAVQLTGLDEFPEAFPGEWLGVPAGAQPVFWEETMTIHAMVSRIDFRNADRSGIFTEKRTASLGWRHGNNRQLAQ